MDDGMQHPDAEVPGTADTAYVPASPPFPWPPAESEPLTTAIARTWRGAALEPRAFFSAMPREGRLSSALLFYIPLAIVQAAAALLWTSVLPGDGLQPEGAAGAFTPLIQFLFSPALALFALIVSGGFVHLLLRMFGGAGGPLTLTLRVFCFAYAPQLLAVIPWVGGVVGFVWMVVVAIIGLAAAHRTSTGRAATAVLIPVVILLFMMGIAMLVMRAGMVLEGMPA